MVMELLTRTLVTEPYAGVNTDVWKEEKKTSTHLQLREQKVLEHTGTCDSHFSDSWNTLNVLKRKE